MNLNMTVTELETISGRSIIIAVINIKIDYTKFSGASESEYTFFIANGTRYKARIYAFKVKGNVN